MKRITVHLDYTTLIIEDLQEVWIQPASLNERWLLCYSDAKYKQKIIYRSTNKDVLRRAGKKLLTAYENGEKEVKI